MNKSKIRQILGNLKAAVRLGLSDTVTLALDGLRAQPQVAANDHLSAGHLDQLVRPAGDILSRLPADQLLPLVNDTLATLRAMGAVALAQRFFSGEDVNQSVLLVPGKDPRPEVRIALGETLRNVGEANPERLLRLVETWLGASSPKLRATALVALPALTESRGKEIINLLKPFKEDQDHDVRAALVEALQTIAQKDLAKATLSLLEDWSTEPHPNVWVITRTLSGSWSAAYPEEVEALLRNLHAKVGQTKSITNALKALERHGAKIKMD